MIEIPIYAFYAWYLVPVIGAVFPANYYSTIFVALFVLGWLGVCFVYRKGSVPVSKLYLVAAVYLVPIIIMGMLNIADAKKTVNVNALFFLSVILYVMTKDKEVERRIALFLIIAYLVTSVTSLIGLFKISNAARAISHARTDIELQASYRMMNIAGSFFFQALVMLVAPILAISQKYGKKAWGYASVGFILFVLLKASFTITIFGFLFALLCYAAFQETPSRKKLVGILVCAALLVLIAFIGIDNVFLFFAHHIGSTFISERLNELALALKLGMSSLSATSDTALRMKNYSSSLLTFVQNPFGIGPYYSYVSLDRGIGYHSQILDDMARYGVVAVAFYIFFFMQFYRMMEEQWEKIGRRDVAVTSTVMYFFFLLMNIGFRSGAESAMYFFVLPAIPNLVLGRQKAKTEQWQV